MRTCRSLAKDAARNSLEFCSSDAMGLARFQEHVYAGLVALTMEFCLPDALWPDRGHLGGITVNQVPVQNQLQAAAIWAGGRYVGRQYEAARRQRLVEERHQPFADSIRQ